MNLNRPDMRNSTLLVFDLGRVFVDFDYKIAIEKIAPRCKISPQAIYDRIIKSNLFTDYESGSITTYEFFVKATELTGFDGTFNEFAAYLTGIFTPIERMINVLEECRTRGFKTYLFSNTNELVVEHFRNSFTFFNNFDGYIFSFEHRVLKPDERIYRILENKSGFRGDKIIYFDDLPENVKAGLKLGWRAFVHKNADSTRETLVLLGVLK